MELPTDNNWRLFVSEGSGATLNSGHAVTSSTGTHCPPYWFSGDTTIILGANPSSDGESQSETVALWRIHVDTSSLRRFSQGFLVVACVRHFGGLHSYKRDSRVDIFLNERQIDGFALRIKPPDHSDYFHRVPVPDSLPSLTPISACRTIYAWSLPKGILGRTEKQTIKIRIDRGVRWDIDYVCLLLQTRSSVPRVFLSYSWSDKELATRLVDILEDLDVDVWFDEAEMTIGALPGDEVRRAIEKVHYVVVLLSEHSLKSKWVAEEIEIALQIENMTNRVKVLPVILEDCDIPSALRNRICEHLRSLDDVGRVAAIINSRLRS